MNVADELFSRIEILDRCTLGDFEHNFVRREVAARELLPQEAQYIRMSQRRHLQIDRHTANEVHHRPVLGYPQKRLP